jgi:hypothetical protein
MMDYPFSEEQQEARQLIFIDGILPRVPYRTPPHSGSSTHGLFSALRSAKGKSVTKISVQAGRVLFFPSLELASWFPVGVP